MDESKKTNILLVDDRPDKLLALETMLEDLNENLVSVRSGDDALRELLRQDFAVILLDVNMPGMDGFETAAMIRRRKRSETTPIIFVSAVNDTENHVSRGYSLGAVDYILTPVVPEILRAKIAVFVELFRKTEQIRRQAREHAELVREQAARAEAEAAQRRLAFLAEASKVLAGSLDSRQTFANLARLVVPRLADFCLIDRLDEEGFLQQVAVAHRDPEKEALLRQIRDPENGEGSVSLRVFSTGKPELCQDLTPEMIREGFSHDENLVGEIDPGSYFAVPLIARGEIVGAITLVNDAGGRTFAPDDLTLAEEFAQRAALALDNAFHYQAADRARHEAEAANRAKDQFLAMLSHELRTPLTPVITSLINLESNPEVPDSMRHPLGVIRRNVELEARLIDDLLDLTRVGSGKIHLNPEIVDAKSLLDNAIEICQPDIQARELEFTLHSELANAYVRADPARLQQIFWNVLKNAVKFTPAGRIDVRLSAEADGRLKITFTDTGQGIAADFLPRIFSPFEQGASTQFGGLGLGLSITKGLVDLHQGEIHVESEGPGKGATFTLYLPLSEAPDDRPEIHRTSPEADRGSIHILLLEDNVDSNDSLTLLLQLRGYQVTSAYNVETAIRHARENDFDVLISDLGLPDGTAGEVMSIVAEQSAGVGIAISGYGMEEDIQRSRAIGFSHHLVKPVEVGRLGTVLDELPRRKKDRKRRVRKDEG